MNEAINMGRLRPMIRQCRTGACPCPPGTCQLDSAIRQVEIDYGELPPSLESLRDEINTRLADLEAACNADTDPDFFADLHNNPVTRERRTDVRYQIAVVPIRLELADGNTVDAEMIDASFQGAGLFIPREAATTIMVGDQVRVMREDLCQTGEIRGIKDVDDRTRMAVVFVADLPRLMRS
jgi:hypothetical protein